MAFAFSGIILAVTFLLAYVAALGRTMSSSSISPWNIMFTGCAIAAMTALTHWF